jgi:hypothetical protein
MLAYLMLDMDLKRFIAHIEYRSKDQESYYGEVNLDGWASVGKQLR